MSIFSLVSNALSSLKLSGAGNGTQNVIGLLQKQEQVRVNQIRDYRAWYNGHHFPTEREDGALPYANLSYAQVEKSIVWLTGKPPQITFRQDIHTVMDELFQEVIDNSGGNSIFYKALQQGGVTGDVILQAYWDAYTNYGKGGVAIKILDSARTFIEYTNAGQLKRMSKVLIQWEELDAKGEVRTVTEIWTPQKVQTFPADSSSSSIYTFPNIDRNKLNTSGPFVEEDNPYGELPFVHITNLILQDSVYGRSDLHDLKTLNKELNDGLVSYKDNVDYTGNPITLLFGLAANQVKRSPGRLWGGLPVNSRVEHLTMDSTHEQIKDYMKLLEKYMGVGGIPIPLLNLETSMSYSDTTNTGLRLYFLPIIELSSRKEMSYLPGFKLIVEMSLRFVNKFFNLQLEELNSVDPALMAKLQAMPVMAEMPQLLLKIIEVRTKQYYECDFKFTELVPKNRMYELMDIDVELRNKLESVRGAMQRLGITDPEAKMREIMEDQKFVASLDQMYAAMSAPPTPETAPFTQMSVDNAAAQLPGSNGQGSPSENQNEADPMNAQKTEATTGQSADTVATKQAGGKPQ